MRLDRREIVSLGVVALGAAAWGLESAGAAPALEEAAVAEAVETLRKAMVDVDRRALETLVADQLSYGHSDGRVQTKAEFIDSLVNKQSVFHSITLSDQKISVAGDIAIVRHRFSAEAISGGKPGSPRIAILQVWRKQDGRWQLLARQGFNVG